MKGDSERDPLPSSALLAAFGSTLCISFTCMLSWGAAGSAGGAKALALLGLFAIVVAVVGNSAFFVTTAAVLAALSVVYADADNLLLIVIAAALLLAALQLFEASRVLRRTPDIYEGFTAGRMLTNLALVVGGAVLTVVVTLVAQSRQWAAALIPVGMATLALGLLIAWFLIRKANRAAHAAGSFHRVQPPPPPLRNVSGTSGVAPPSTGRF